MSLHQSRDSDFSLLLDGKVELDEGDVFLSNPAVKHYWITRQLFELDDSKVLWKLREGENGAQTRLLVIPDGL
jgi:hypothetical protein